MKKIKCIGMYFVFGLYLGCSNDDAWTQEQEAQHLEQLFTKIEYLAHQESCDNSAEWTFTSYGHKACGGPVGYIAFSTTIDTMLFFEIIDEHRAAQHAFNVKWGIISDCSLPPQPRVVFCEDGKPMLEY